MPKSNGKNKQNKRPKGKVIYLDYAAAASPNPSSIHDMGRIARKKLEDARGQVARMLHARPEEIIFTSGGTESNNLALQGAIWAAKIKNPHIITTNIEHPSVLETCRLLEARGLAEVTVVPVEKNGIVDPKKIRKAIQKNTVLVSVMYANNEIGTIEPLREIAREVRHYRKTNRVPYPYFHTDAVQAVHYLDLSVEKLGIDMLSLSGTKVHKAGRVGILYKKKTVRLENIYGGGDQEQGLRPGTENVEAISEFVHALLREHVTGGREYERVIRLRDYFFEKLIPLGAIVNGDRFKRLPHIVSVTFPKIPSDLLVIELSARGVMCSSKSACKSSESVGSYVIEALRPGSDPEIGGLRFSLSPNTTKQKIDTALHSLGHTLEKLKKWY